ncbi:bZIP transcription factor 44-like [Lotus japonicus]|uniref:bZIP transcription factor 44-like n=1 Tax=Lotus japonicus TaxID=34305 RepID=UPI00258C55B5|nr:bZIP transcription factor 44-like [Lotus japonicus]
MASSSGNSSTTTKFQSSGSEGDLQMVMDQRKNKRKQSNRESARRSRMRKQSHLEDLTSQVTQLTKENGEILTNINITSQQYQNVETENSILRAQMGELSQRLQSLNDIINVIKTSAAATTTTTGSYNEREFYQTGALNFSYLNQPITASADIFQW